MGDWMKEVILKTGIKKMSEKEKMMVVILAFTGIILIIGAWLI
jgi:cell division protein FtsL